MRASRRLPPDPAALHAIDRAALAKLREGAGIQEAYRAVMDVTVTPEQFSQLRHLSDQLTNRTIGPQEHAEACLRVCPNLQPYRENRLVVTPPVASERD